MRTIGFQLGNFKVVTLAANAIAVIFLTFAAPAAKAEILFEPYVGYEYDTFNANLTAGSNVAYTVTGPGIGLRLGYAIPIFFFALDYDYGMLNSSVSSQPTGTGYTGGSVVRSSLYGEIGASLPLFQAYVGYSPLNNWSYKANSMGTTDVSFGGSAIKVGAGFTGFPFIAINVDYIISTFTTYTDTSSHNLGDTGTTYSSANANTIMLSVSLPFRI